ncbi:uncharacterized protein LOC133198602 isoform X1 [Saccostrea echinata]|uniref:uncharacterized protein LOC133198602 isoform X1 n=1 Tax=Saccostrea echinata TaxID=191078 RepID=UPI002A81095C|nr:uncharacterized protein LOC133198602 isoform X1 [Saccostrea echinata]
MDQNLSEFTRNGIYVYKNRPRIESSKFVPYLEDPTWVSLTCNRKNCCGTDSNFRSIDTNSLGMGSTFGEIGSPSDVSSLGPEKDRGFLNKDTSKRGKMAVLFLVLIILITFIAAAVGVTLSYVHHRDIVRLHVNFSVDNYNDTLIYQKQQEAEVAEFCRKVKDAFRSTGLISHFIECKCVDTRQTLSKVTFSFLLDFTNNKDTEDMDQIKRIIISVVNERKRHLELRALYSRPSQPTADKEGPVILKTKKEGTTKSPVFVKTTPAEMKSTTQRNRQISSKTNSTTTNTNTASRSNVKSIQEMTVKTTTIATKTVSTTPGMNAWDRLLSQLNIT